MDEREQPKRDTGVTIMMGGQMLFTQEPCQSDALLVRKVKDAHQEWVRDGKPQSGLWM